ncbi:MAG: RluA family pseudouridine synthase, partial [Desulfobacterales bacterium]|nr:RluA family pseudouridine synthase [Desulfobacterales bacterium]
GAARKVGYRLKPGESIDANLPAPASVDMIPEAMAFTIVYEDPSLIVVDKPAGLVVHPAAGHAAGTLVNGLLHHCPDLEGIGGERRPGIVHRLDKDTSGLLVAAKNDRAHQRLSQQFKTRQVHKIYLALVWGAPNEESGCIDRPVGRHAVERKRMAVMACGGREALTLWRVQERLPGTTLLAVELKTGRTHQIRVHCQSIGHPIVGDPVYGRRRGIPRPAKVGADPLAILRQARRHPRIWLPCWPLCEAFKHLPLPYNLVDSVWLCGHIPLLFRRSKAFSLFHIGAATPDSGVRISLYCKGGSAWPA